MAVVKSFELNGNKKSFSNWISNLSPQLTPFTSMIGKEKIDQNQYHWQVDTLAPASLEVYEEGSDVTHKPRRKTDELTNFTSILRKVVHVSDTVAEISQYGKNSELNYQVGKAVKEMKRDLEFMNLNNVSGNPSIADLPGKFFGFEGLCTPAGTIDPDTGAVTHHIFHYEDPHYNHFNIDAIYAVTTNLYIAGSKADKIMFHPMHAKVFSDLLGDCPETPLVYRMFDEMDDKFNLRVSKIRDPLGRWYTLIPNRQMPKDKVFFFNENDWDQMILREPTLTKLAKVGASERYMLEMEVGVRHRHHFASGVLSLKEGITAHVSVAPDHMAIGAAQPSIVATIRMGGTPAQGKVVTWYADHPTDITFRAATSITNAAGVATTKVNGLKEGGYKLWCTVSGVESNKATFTVTPATP